MNSLLFGLTVEKCGAIPPGFAALRRGGHVCAHGKLKEMLAAYKTGDSLLIDYSLWEQLCAATKPPLAPSAPTRHQSDQGSASYTVASAGKDATCPDT